MEPSVKEDNDEGNNCPVVHGGGKGCHKGYAPLNAQGEIDKKTKTIPYQWWKFGMFNFLRLKFQGFQAFQNDMIANNSTVYRMKLNEWQIMVCDHLAMDALFDLDKVKRDLGLGFLPFKTNMLHEHIPCMLTNDEEHEKKKAFIISFMKDIHEHLTITEIVKVAQKEFENMEPVKFSNKREAESFNFEYVISKLAGNVSSYLLLGEYVDDHASMDEWVRKTLKVPGISWGSSGDDNTLTTTIFEMFKSMKKMKDLNSKFGDSGLDTDEMLSQMVFAGSFNAIAGIKVNVMHCLLCYLRLAESDKQLLQEDAATFFAASSYEETLPKLKHVHAFFLETLRMHPFRIIYGRAKKDFLLTSTNGNFQVKENELLCGCLHLIQRDPELFVEPDAFMLNRPVEECEKYNFAYGGYFHGKSDVDNHRCAGALFLHDVLKVFIIFFTKCLCVPVKVPMYTAGNFGRLEGSDEPLHMLEFAYIN